MIDSKIINWVKESYAKGYSRKQISDKLLKSGYTYEQINSILSTPSKKENKVPETNQPIPTKKKNWKLWIGLIVIFGVLIIGIIFILNNDNVETSKEISEFEVDLNNLKEELYIEPNELTGDYNQELSSHEISSIEILNLENSRAIIQKGDSRVTNNIRIFGDLNEVEVLLSGQEPSEEFIGHVIIDSNQKTLSASGFVKLEFLKGNEFLEVENTDKVIIEIADSELKLSNRDEQNLIPKLEFTQTGDYYSFSINNGIINLLISFDLEYIKINNTQYITSSPTSVEFDSSIGEQIISDGNKLLISNYNEYAIIPKNSNEGKSEITENYDYAPVNLKNDLSFNYGSFSKENFQENYPNIKLFGNTNPDVIKRMQDTLNHLPKILSDHEFSIFVLGVDENIKKVIEDAEAVTDTQGNLYLKDYNLVDSIIYHELIHSFTRNYRHNLGSNELNNKALEILNEIEELGSNDPKLDQLNKDFEFFNNLSEQKKHSVEKEWIELVEGFGISDKIKNVDGFDIWIGTNPESEESTSPKDGYVSPYGATYYEEDMATFVENVYKNPEFFKPLISSSSSNYHELYLKKLSLLKKYGLIEDDAYANIISQ